VVGWFSNDGMMTDRVSHFFCHWFWRAAFCDVGIHATPPRVGWRYVKKEKLEAAVEKARV